MAITLDGNNGITSPDFEPSSSTVPTNGLFLPTTNTLAWATNSTERLRLDASGNLGLGVTPSGWGSAYKTFQVGAGGSFACGSSNATAILLGANTYENSSGTEIYLTTNVATKYQQASGSHRWYTAPSGTAGNAISFTQAMTLDASGNLGIGTTTLTAGSTSGFNFLPGSATISYATGSNGAASLWLGNDNNGSNSSNGTNCGYIAFRARFNGIMGGGNDIAAIYGTYTGDGTTRSGAIRFLTLNAGTEAERARIDSSGNLLVGTTTAPSSGKMNIVNGLQMTGASTGTAIASNNGSAEVAYLTLGAVFNVAGSYDVALGISNIATTAGKRIYVQNRTAGVYLADGGTSWTSNSDERLKTDLKPIENAAQKVSTLRAVTGRFKTDDESVSRSFLIAQDVQAVLPEAVDASDPDKLGVQYTDTIPLLVAAIKELTARLETLENK